MVYGWVVEQGTSVDRILDKIHEIKNDKQNYRRIKCNFENYKFKKIEQMQNEYYHIYDNCIDTKNQAVGTAKMDELQRKADVYDLRILRENLTNELNQLYEYKNKYNFLVERYHKKENTKIYQIFRKINGGAHD